MDLSINNLEWFFFKGSEVKASLLQKICLFRSYVLYDSGFRMNFSKMGNDFGDIQYTDFESYHLIACFRHEILGTVRVTPFPGKTVAQTVLGEKDYGDLVSLLGTSNDKIIEINRLMIDPRFRKLNLGKTLMYASIALIENTWSRNEFTIIGSAGNCTQQAKFFLDHTDYKKIPNVSDKFASTFNDEITFLKYDSPPYSRGAEQINYFQKNLKRINVLNPETFKATFSEDYQTTI